jgi:hypothetical protein
LLRANAKCPTMQALQDVKLNEFGFMETPGACIILFEVGIGIYM